jgi:hypothetical protein
LKEFIRLCAQPLAVYPHKAKLLMAVDKPCFLLLGVDGYQSAVTQNKKVENSSFLLSRRNTGVQKRK